MTWRSSSISVTRLPLCTGGRSSKRPPRNRSTVNLSTNTLESCSRAFPLWINTSTRMNSILRKLVGMNWLMVALVIGLSVFGIMAIYSATYMREEVYLTEMWRRQIVWLAIGIVVFFVAALIDYRAWLNHVSFPLIMYLGGLGFLTLTHFIGRTTYGARSWLDIGPISFQPAQLAVISTL